MTRSRKGRILVYTNSIGGKPIDPTNLADGTVIVYDQINDVYHYVDLTTVFALIDHTHSQYLTEITKAMVEGVLTGNITTHVHNQYLTAITKAMVEAVLTGTITTHNHNGTYALVAHNHDADYSPIGHDHAGVYAPATHSHAEYLTGITKAMVEAVLTGTITSHNHSGVYALVAHNHDGVYEPVITKNTAFNKNFGTTAGTVSEGNHTHSQYLQSITKAMVEAVLTGTITSHDHSGVYSPASHVHDDRYYTETEVDDLLAGKSGTGHTHDDRYFTETEITTLLSGKSDSGHDHSGVYEPVFTKNTAFNKNFGTTVGTVCQGNDARLSDSRPPTAHTHDDRYYTESEINTLLAGKSDSGHNHSGVYEPAFSKLTAFNKNFGTAAGTICQGNDSRLSDARTPTAHTHDDRYYTESEVNSLLSGKSDSSHSHSYLPLAGGALTGKVTVGAANRSAGMYGYYHSSYIGHVWSMGSGYSIPDNGADFGNLYGMAYKHTNNTTGGTMAGGHQIVFCSAGTPGAAIGLAGAIWAKTGFLKNGSSDSYLLLGGGGHKAVSDFAISGHNHSGVYEPAFSKGTAFNKNFGTTVDTVCQGNDSRLSDARTPTAHTHDDRYYTETEVNNLIAGKSDTSHNHSGVYEPAFSKNNAFNKNFGTAAGTVCQGNDSRLSNVRTPSDNSVTYAKLNSTLTSRQAVGASAIDWSLGGVYTKTLTAATTLTFSNLQLNKVITLVASGNFTITLPAYCKRISGEYDGSTTNYIQFHCTNNASGSEEVWYTISKQAS